MKVGTFNRNDPVFLLLILAFLAVPVCQWWVIRGDRCPVSPGDGVRIIQPVSGRPGSIFCRARNGSVLVAASRKIPGCFVDPSLLDGRKEISDLSCRLSDVLDMNAGQIYALICRRSDRKFAWIKHGLTQQEAEKCMEMPDLAVGIQYEWKREYPCGSTAGTVIGARRKDNLPVCGIEQALHRAIRSSDGRVVFSADVLRRPFAGNKSDSLAPENGRDVHLTIDINIQGYLQDAVRASVEKFDAEWGAGVVIDPWTGDILAMSSCPDFDPNSYNRVPVEHMVNRVISFPFEPGSALKPVMAAAAVESGVAGYDTVLYCENGVYHALRGGRISDHGQSYGNLSVEDGVVYSSNILMAKLGELMGNRRMYRAVVDWGFGHETGIALPSESPGILRPADKWDGYSLRRVPFGQEISTTLLQLGMAFSAIGNGGVLMKPRLVTAVVDTDGKKLYEPGPEPVRRVLSKKNARRTRYVMKAVVERGTGKNCRLDSWSCWGKTGTAQVAGPGGYVEGAYTSTFVGGAPVDKPGVICLISIYRPDRNKGYYGSVVAAPYVRNVLEKTLRYLCVPEDR